MFGSRTIMNPRGPFVKKNNKNGFNRNGRSYAALDELRSCISRIEEIVEKNRPTTAIVNQSSLLVGSSNNYPKKGNNDPRHSTKPKARRGKRSRLKNNDTDSMTQEADDDVSSVTTNGSFYKTTPKTPLLKMAQFIGIETNEEKELIELIRRLAEIVVLAERAVSQDLDDPDVAVFEHFCERNTLGLIVSIVTGSAFTKLEETPTTKTPTNSGDNSESSNKADDMSADTASTLGDSIISSELQMVYLPPLSVATQAVQSVSILIQNVVRVTSLYFLLSNNRVNDLINLPLELYGLAEEREKELLLLDQQQQRKGPHQKNNSNKDGNDASNHHRKQSNTELSAEISELSTHFISFLKSLAMRMNVETLQFFLKYPTAILDENDPTPQTVDFPLYARALEFCSPNHDNFVRVTAMNICLNTLRLGAVNEEESDDQNDESVSSLTSISPDAYDDASVSSEHISKSKAQSLANGLFKNDGTIHVKLPEEKKSPDAGTLHNAQILPLRERLAILQHLCEPARMESLMSPIFFKLAQLCGCVEDSIRSLEKIDAGIRSSLASTSDIEQQIMRKKAEADSNSDDSNDNKSNKLNRILKRKGNNGSQENVKIKEKRKFFLEKSLLSEEKKKRRKLTKERDKVVQSIDNYVADLQDELLLLEDVLLVGLVTFNEQIIEMMFATFIYPLLLQPLSLYMQRHRPTLLSNTLNDDSKLSSSMNAVSISGVSQTQQNDKAISASVLNTSHPFAVTNHIPSFNRSGLDNKGIGKECDGDIEDDNKSSNIPKHNFKHLIYDNQDNSFNPDSAPAKTALFAVASIFHVISNKPLLHLMLTALLHPLAPDPSVGFMVSRKQQILTVNDKGKPKVKVESIMRANRKSNSIPECYKFGTDEPEEKSTRSTAGGKRNSRDNDKSTFVLSPALADVFEGAIYGKAPSMVKTRTNPYRRVFLACLAGTDGMSTLQSFAVFVLDVMLSSLSSRVLNEVLFGAKVVSREDDTLTSDLRQKTNTGEKLEGHNSSSKNYMVEVIASMCVSVMTATSSVNGIWRLNFDPVASHALLCATMVNKLAKATASKLIEHRCRQSLSFLTQLPSKLSNLSLSGNPINVINHKKDQEVDFSSSIAHDSQRLNLIMDQLFYDPMCSNDKYIIENIFRKKETSGDHDDWSDSGYLLVARESSIEELCHLLCTDISSMANSLDSENYDTPGRFAADSTASHLQLDAFSKVLKEGNLGDIDDTKQGCSGVSALVYNKKGLIEQIGGDDRTLFTPLSETLNALFFEEKEGNSHLPRGHESQCPSSGSVVGLVGRAAFPCVCEVAEECDALFTDKAACVIAEGVKWQSLYLVLLGKYLILAEPEKGGSGGNGRVVTACRLSCLHVEKDDPPAGESASPARRLLLTHSSPNLKPPSVFTLEPRQNKQTKTNQNNVIMNRSRMDLWFEDALTAGHAYKVLSTKIMRARARRGNKVRESLTQNHNVGFSTLFDSP